MNLFVVIIHIIVCFVLITVILLQAGRGQGLTGSSFGGGNVQSLFGTKASSFLTKATTGCAILFLFTCIGLNIIEVQKSRSLFRESDAQAPLDVEQIKKALEKIKKTDPSVATASETDVAKAAATAQEDTPDLTEAVNNEVSTAAATPETPKP